MNKKKRTILFLFLAILFSTLAPLAIFYSLGWRIDWESKKITQPGIFYFKIQPKNAQIYINGKLEDKTDPFFGSSFIENLLPKKYEIVIKKDRYHDWRKTLEIEKGKVTEAKNIILIAQDPYFEIMPEKTLPFEEKKLDNAPDDIIAYSILKENVYYLGKNGFVYRTDISFIGSEKLNTNPLQIKKEADYEITASPFNIAIRENQTLYYLNKKIPEKISDSAKGAKFSPDLKKLVFFNDHEIWVFFLERRYEQPQKEAGEKMFLNRFSEKITDVFWLTNHYLILSVEDKIKIAEIDDRDRINIVDLAGFKSPEIFWDENSKKLYVLSNKTLYLSEKLIP